MALNKSLHEGFAKFFEKPTRDGLRELLKSSIGETDNFDFKEILPEKDKLAKHLLAMANSDGGIIVVGVTDDNPPIHKGISDLEDKADIYKKVVPYIPKSLQFEILDFSYKESEYNGIKGKSFQVIIVESDRKELPYLCLKSGKKIKNNVVYIRKGTSSEEATHDELQRIINKRIETGFSSTNILSLEEHIGQLKSLYNSITVSHRISDKFGLYKISTLMTSLYHEVPNPHYPKESFDEFISEQIKRKKIKIQKLIEIDI